MTRRRTLDLTTRVARIGFRWALSGASDSGAEEASEARETEGTTEAAEGRRDIVGRQLFTGLIPGKEG